MGLWHEGTQRRRRQRHPYAENDGLFVAAAVATTVAASLTLFTPRLGVGFDVVALLLVCLNLRRRLKTRAQERLLSRAIDSSMEALTWEENLRTKGTIRVSTSAEHFMGHPIEAWRTPNFWRSIVHPEDLEHVHAEVAKSVEIQSSYQVTFRAFDGRGQVRWLEKRATSIRSRDNDHLLYAGVIVDRTAQIEATDEADVLRRVVEESPLAHLIARRGDAACFDVISMNATCCELFATSQDESIGLPVGALLGRRPGMEGLLPLLVSDGDVETMEIRLTLAVDDARGSLPAMVLEAVVQRIGERLIAVSFVDITERVLSNERLLELALHDVLTGLPNRRLLAERLTTELARSEASQGSTALVVLDLNEFKEVNDALGHDTGDHLLRAIGARLDHGAPPNALVARLGGDEFAVLLPDTTLAEAVEHAHRLAAITREPVDIGGLTLQIRASLGVVAAPDHGYDTADLMRLADVAMYASKRTGDDVTCYRTDVDPFSKRRVRLLGELEAAIEAGQFEVFYQPIIDLVTGRVVSTEGLLRWRHPELGLVPPVEFIELAELTGVIGDLTRFVVGQVLRDNAIMERAGFPIQVSCNLSTRNLFEADFVEAVGELIELYGMPAGGLRLEITEGDVMEDVVKARKVMRALAKLGASLAIDDFGTGHSSLERLRDLPVSCVKIDQSFVRALLDGPRSHTLLRDIITMLENLGFTTVAEGIEDESSRDLLAEFGCTHGQGYLWARPLPLPDFIGLLSADEAQALGSGRPKAARSIPSAAQPQSTK